MTIFDEQLQIFKIRETLVTRALRDYMKLDKTNVTITMLQPLQRERLMKNVCCGLSSRAIAKQEGVYYSSVDKSIAAAKKNFIKFYENL